jgi:hypothetical protein
MVVLRAVSLDWAERTVHVGAAGVARLAEVPAISWYSSGLCYSPPWRGSASFLRASHAFAVRPEHIFTSGLRCHVHAL